MCLLSNKPIIVHQFHPSIAKGLTKKYYTKALPFYHLGISGDVKVVYCSLRGQKIKKKLIFFFNQYDEKTKTHKGISFWKHSFCKRATLRSILTFWFVNTKSIYMCHTAKLIGFSWNKELIFSSIVLHVALLAITIHKA